VTAEQTLERIARGRRLHLRARYFQRSVIRDRSALRVFWDGSMGMGIRIAILLRAIRRLARGGEGIPASSRRERP